MKSTDSRTKCPSSSLSPSPCSRSRVICTRIPGRRLLTCGKSTRFVFWHNVGTRVRRITCLGVASRGNLLAHSHNASCLQRQCARAYDVMMKVLRWLHRESKVCEMIRPCCLHRKAKSHTRLIPNCCAVRSKETHRLIHPRSSRVLKNTDKTSRAPRIPNTFAAERQHQTTGRLLQVQAAFQQSLPCLVFLTCSGRPVQSGTTRPASQCPFLKITPEAQVP